MCVCHLHLIVSFLARIFHSLWAQLFTRFDSNSDGVLSLSEVDRAVRDAVGLDSIFSSKPLLRRALDLARGAKHDQLTKASRNKDKVERDEFRKMLLYMKYYFTLYITFDRVDRPSDERISLADFRSSLDRLKQWGIELYEQDADKEFQSIAGDGCENVHFDDFCHFAISRKMTLLEEDESGLSEPNSPQEDRSASRRAGVMPHLRGQQFKGSELPQMPEWRKRVVEGNKLTEKLIRGSNDRESAAREKIARLKARAQRELTRATSLAAIEDQRVRKMLAVSQARAEADALVGRDLTQIVKDVPDLTDEEIHSFSVMFNEHLKFYDPSSTKPGNFFGLFKAMDIDGSRRIGFGELEHMVRRHLRVNDKKMPSEKLYALWKRLDENRSGFVDAGELSRFLRIGKPNTMTPVQIARAALQLEKQKQMALVRAESQKRLEKQTVAKLYDVERASDADVSQFGDLFAKKLQELRPRNRDNVGFYDLFKSMDRDGSGRVKFEEFENMVRKDFKIGATSLANEKLWSLWSRIDIDDNGFICVGEFGKFMRAALRRAAQTTQDASGVIHKKRVENMAKEAYAELKREETWAQRTATSSMETAEALEAEAERLEQLLGKVSEVKQRSPSTLAVTNESQNDEDFSTPAKRKETLQRLMKEVKNGGGRNRIAPDRSPPQQVLLRSFAREEGQIF